MNAGRTVDVHEVVVQHIGDMKTRIGKVLAYVLKDYPDDPKILVFEHVDVPEAGIQVPAGSIDPGEAPDQAIIREVAEETGVNEVRIVRYLGQFEHHFVHPPRDEMHDRHVYLLTPTTSLGETWSHTVSAGVGDQGLTFRCYWLPVEEAVDALAGGQGNYIMLVTE